MQENLPAVRNYDNWIASRDPRRIAELAMKFLETAVSGTGKATAYNTKQTQETVLQAVHEEMFKTDRGLYALLSSMGGTMDISRQIATHMLLDNPTMSRDEQASLLFPEEENILLAGIVSNLPDSRQVKLYKKLRGTNNARTRGVILRTLFGQKPERIEAWAIKYRMKLRDALRHAWGSKYFGGLKKLFREKGWDFDAYYERDKTFVHRHILRFATHAKTKEDTKAILQSVAYIFGVEGSYTLKGLKAVGEVKAGNIDAGKHLPPEVLEGLRSRYFPDVERTKTVELSKDNASRKQKAQMVRQAARVGVKMSFDPNALDAVELYIYAFEMGLTEEIEQALNDKAAKAASFMPSRFGKAAIVVDDSSSHKGSREQKLRPLAVTLATRDMLLAASDAADVITVSGQEVTKRIPFAKGDTELATPLLKALEGNPDAVFVISDGYENVEAGLFQATLQKVRQLGIKTPVFHINPVMAAEAAGVRSLAPGLATTIPISKPQELGATYIRGVLEQNPIEGLKLLVERASREVFEHHGVSGKLAYKSNRRREETKREIPTMQAAG
jgi:hypothetical protein